MEFHAPTWKGRRSGAEFIGRCQIWRVGRDLSSPAERSTHDRHRHRRPARRPARRRGPACRLPRPRRRGPPGVPRVRGGGRAGRDRDRAAGRRLGRRPARPQPARRRRAALRGRGGARRAAGPHARRLRPRGAGRDAEGPGELRGGGALGARPRRRGVHALRRRPRSRCCGARRAGRRATTGRAEQHEVWSMVGEKAMRHAASSETGALRDVFSARDEVLRRVRVADPARGGPARGRSRRSADRSWSSTWRTGPMSGPRCTARSSRGTRSTPSSTSAAACRRRRRSGWPSACWRPRSSRRAAVRPGVGLGAEMRFATVAAQGARLVHDGELVALTAFPGEGPAPIRVRRPSRRRSA